MRILLGHVDYEHPTSIRAWYESWLARLRASGIAVDAFCLTIDQKKPLFGWPELDQLWQTGDRQLLGMYEQLARRLESYDVFVNYNGINVHPEFVSQLDTFNVYGCFDDPEASENLSRPVAAAYDLAMVGNIAELDTYRSWGVRNVRHWPLGFRVDDYDPRLTRERILNGERDVDLALTCERETAYRRERLDKFAAAFPRGAYFGKGWPNGFLPEDERVPLYQRTRLGINIHNSTGPINFRTFILPANGVMQICDNKSHLGKIYELGKEAAGFETIEEAIELGHYYLDHDDERRRIAAAGWERAVRDYNEVAVFQRMMAGVAELRKPVNESNQRAVIYLQKRRRRLANKQAFANVRTRLRAASSSLKCALSYVRAAIARRVRVLKHHG
ncbi:MAG TPA: glycosyltransferase [Pyrinomonadaceae bacterium]|nr:glycosyltransferase [Pyrinomonadaceae bacterium]